MTLVLIQSLSFIEASAFNGLGMKATTYCCCCSQVMRIHAFLSISRRSYVLITNAISICFRRTRFEWAVRRVGVGYMWRVGRWSVNLAYSRTIWKCLCVSLLLLICCRLASGCGQSSWLDCSRSPSNQGEMPGLACELPCPRDYFCLSELLVSWVLSSCHLGLWSHELNHPLLWLSPRACVWSS